MCDLCNTIHEQHRLIKQTQYSFCIICLDPLKFGHVMVLPKRHVTQTNMSYLTAEESKDLIWLLDEIQDIIETLTEESAIILKNNWKHMTQSHLHFHVLPSKWYLRNLIWNFENIPERVSIRKEQYIEMKKNIQSKLKDN